jgi:wyosine [tRNA(Phe)-imidazoG37] synthetase (radical SAM superfamily)
VNKKRKFVFGPVLSRRLGRSLGVDTVPLKTCTYDCVYCQLGRTPGKTAKIKKYSSPDDILVELGEALEEAEADYITISGSGEPSLNSETGNLISGIKKISGIPVCVITNGSLLSRKEVRERLEGADLVIPSLDAGDEETFKRINRPHNSISFRGAAEGIRAFSKEFSGKLRLEVMLVKGINDSVKNLENFLPLIESINPDRIQLNTVVRPPAYSGIYGVSPEKLKQAAGIFGPKAEIIAPVKTPAGGRAGSLEEVLATIRRRPSTVEDISSYLGMNISEALKHITRLVEEKAVTAVTAGKETYYKPYS